MSKNALKVKCLMNPGRITLRAYVEGAEIYFRVNKVSISLTQKIDSDISAENRKIIADAFVKINEVYEAKTAEGLGHVEMTQAIVEAIESKDEQKLEDEGFSVPSAPEAISEELIAVLKGKSQRFEFQDGKFMIFNPQGSQYQIARAGDILLENEKKDAVIAVSGKTARVLAFREPKVAKVIETPAAEADPVVPAAVALPVEVEATQGAEA